MMFDRLLKIISEEEFKKIKNANILLVGIGGVGGFSLEALVRCGFNNITIVDGDVVDKSNLNRQIISNSNNIGKNKTEVAQERVLRINPNINLKTINKFLNKDNFYDYINDNYDYIIDACDDMQVKVALIKYAMNNNIKIITALGTGKKLDSTKLEITTLNKTFNDPLAKKLRSELRKENISLDIPVVFSKEEAINKDNIIGSAIFVPGVAGLMLANYVFLDILNKNK